MIHRLSCFLHVTTQSESFLYFASILEPPKPFNLTLYTLKDNRKVPNVLWYTFGHPDFFTLIVCKIEKTCYKKMVHQETKKLFKDQPMDQTDGHESRDGKASTLYRVTFLQYVGDLHRRIHYW